MSNQAYSQGRNQGGLAGAEAPLDAEQNTF